MNAKKLTHAKYVKIIRACMYRDSRHKYASITFKFSHPIFENRDEYVDVLILYVSCFCLRHSQIAILFT